jgi:hypothetical protein
MEGGEMTRDEWCKWFMENVDHDEELLNAVRKIDPKVFESYLATHTEDNPYLFKPKGE